MAKHQYFLKMVGAADDPLAERWAEAHPKLLSEVRTPKVPRAIHSGDLLVYYASGHQRLIAIARSTIEGAQALDVAEPGEERWPYVVPVQVLLLIPTITLAPDWEVLGMSSSSIQQQSYVEIKAGTYAKAWEAIVKRTKPAG